MPKLAVVALLIVLGAQINALPNHIIRTSPGPDGRMIDIVAVPGIPEELRDPGPIAAPRRNAVLLNGVPAFNWCYGCSATSAAMMAGYYDRGVFSHVYTGPTNGGMMPLNNASWGVGECPLSATHMGYDGLTAPGHVDRFWTNNAGDDPFGAADPTGTYWGCTADYMGTNQQWWGNGDGSTTFAFYVDGSALHDPGDGSDGPPFFRDGIHGLRLFFESRGYAVSDNYNQYIYGWDGNPNGYTYDQYKASIDAGIPVMIQIQGHSMVGLGYESGSDIIYVHNTWDHSLHSMTWGGVYSGMAHYGVGIIQLNPPPQLQISDVALQAALLPDSAGTDQIVLSNTGSGLLQYELTLQSLRRQDNDGNLNQDPLAEDRSIAGSTLTLDALVYDPGTSSDWTFSLFNNSPDDEWLQHLYITFPAGITVNSATNFTGGGGGDMVPDLTGGSGITIHWYGESGGWGVVYPGNTATANLNVSISAGHTGAIVLPYEIRGDVYGSDPHVLTGQLVIDQADPLLPWCSLVPVYGVVEPGANLTLTGYFSSLGLMPGAYAATLALNSNDPWNPAQPISVSLDVLAPAPPVITSIQPTLNGIGLNWDPVPGAARYGVYRSTRPDTGFVWLGWTDLCSYEDTACWSTAFYRITAEF